MPANKAKSQSFSALAWRRLKKNKAAMIGLLTIVIATIMAVFAYVIAPDHTPYANNIILEVGGKAPGFTMQMLLIPKDQPPEKEGFFQRVFYGRPNTYDMVPITAYQLNGSQLKVKHYIDEGMTNELVYPLQKIYLGDNQNPTRQQVADYILHHQIVKRTFWLGTDKYGRDILSRLIVGIRVSLSVGLIAVVISLSIGIFLGAVAGFFRGWIDDVVMWLINVVWSIPTLLLVFAITIGIGKGFWQIFIAVGLTMWVSVARIIRGQVLALREMEFIEATKALGFSNARTIARHILPNIMGPVLVVAANNFATAIVVEAGLSFLGIGVQPPMPSWGLMIKENYGFIITHNPFLAIIPGIAIMIMVLAFNMLGNGLRDALDVRGK